MITMALLKLFVTLLTFFTLAALGDDQRQITISHTDYHTTACQHFAATLKVDDFPNLKVNFAEYLPAGTTIQLSQDYGLNSCGWKTQAVTRDICRIAAYVPTSEKDSGLTFEAWLPNKDEWNERFLSTGNGGNSGCIRYPDLGYTSGLGFAAVGQSPSPLLVNSKLTLIAANNGHNGSSGIVSILLVLIVW